MPLSWVSFVSIDHNVRPSGVLLLALQQHLWSFAGSADLVSALHSPTFANWSLAGEPEVCQVGVRSQNENLHTREHSCPMGSVGSRDKERNLGTEPPRPNGRIRGAACVIRSQKVLQVKEATSGIRRMAASANIPRNTFMSGTGWFLLQAQHVETGQCPLLHVWMRSRELGRTRRSFQGSR
jgi:hypothetical protein